MPSHPYWSGSIRISLVGFSVQLYTATRRASQVPLHEYDRKTGTRIRHQNVNDEGDLIDDDRIIKGFEVSKNEFIAIEKNEIENLKIVSSDTLELTEFVPRDSISLLHYERPYFVMPTKKADEEIYAVFRQALMDTKMLGIGQIAIRGREELCAVAPYENGLILETLRYPSELQNSAEFFDRLKGGKSKSDYLTLAKQLIEKNSRPPNFSRFHDGYHEALMQLIDDKKHHRRAKTTKAKAKPAKVIDFADALRKSLGQSAKAKEPMRRVPTRKRG